MRLLLLINNEYFNFVGITPTKVAPLNNMFNKILIIFIFSFAFSGNTGKLSGIITDSESKEILLGVNVLVEGTPLGAATNLEGEYFILFIPPGKYNVKATAIGYTTSIYKNVTISADLTTQLNFNLKQKVLEGEEIVVTAEKPLVETDLVSSRNTITSEMIEKMPVEDVNDMLNLTAGFVDGHARGGRDGEILYLINGVPAVDPMYNSFDTDVPEAAIAETDIITSGFSVEYSNALSGVVNMVMKEGGPTLAGSFRAKTSDNAFINMFPGEQQNRSFEGSLGGPLFDFPVRWFISGEFSEDMGRYGVAFNNSKTIMGSFTWRPFSKTKIQLSINHHNRTYNSYSHRYSRTTYENEDSDLDGRLDRTITVESKNIIDPNYYNEGEALYGLNMENVLDIYNFSGNLNDLPKRFVLIEVDMDGSGNVLQGDGDFINEDLNANGVWDIVDLNNNSTSQDSSFIDINNDGVFQWNIDEPVPNTTDTVNADGYNIIPSGFSLTSQSDAIGFNDSFNMLDHLLRNEEKNTHISLSLNHQFAKNTFLQVFLSQFKTYYHYNTEESADIPAYASWLDENNISQELITKYKDDLLTDWNNNDFIDITENAYPNDPTMWKSWGDIPVTNDQDIDKFYSYGSGATFYRLRWNEDEKTTTNIKSILTSQVTNHHLIKVGFEINNYDIFDHDVDIPSGGNLYGQNIGSNNNWGHTSEEFEDVGFDTDGDGVIDFGSSNGVWDHWDYGEDGLWAVDGNNDGDYDDDFIDLPPDASENNGKVDEGELAEPWIDIYNDDTWNTAQQKLDPVWWGLFVEDKMEFESLVVVSGLRLDYFDPKFNNFPTDIEDPVVDQTTGGEVKNPTSVGAKYYWSPRIGIAYPITHKDALYFNYGKTFQVPQFQYMYRNINWDFSGAFPIVGNPDILPEMTTSYELGVRHQMGNNWRLEVKGFYKDINGLVDTKQIWIKANQYYTRHINGDYGNVKGFEIDLFKRFNKLFGGNVNYTYSIAKGKSSSATQNYSYTWASQVIPREESYLDWDQRHTINASINLLVPYIWTNVNTTMQYGSGLPYSPPPKSADPEVNTKRLPSTFTVNLYADKTIPLKGFGENTSVSFFIWVDNLFDTKNVQGIADESWYDQFAEYQSQYEAGNTAVYPSEDDNNGIDDDGDGYIDETFSQEYMMIMDTNGDGDIDENKQYPASGTYSDPRYYSEGRRIKIGVSFKF